MRLAEALARCPSLVLVRARPGARRGRLGAVAAQLEAIGAAVEPSRPARRSSPPSRCAASAAAPRRSSPGRGVELGARPGWAPARTGSARAPRRCGCAPGDRPCVVSGAAAERVLAGLPVSALHGRLGERAAPAGRRRPSARAEEIACVDSLERLGVRTLGDLAALPAAAIADRFGAAGAAGAAAGARASTSRCAPGAPRGDRVQARPARGRLGPAARARARPADRAPARPSPAARDGRSAGCGSRRGSPGTAAGARRSRCAAPAVGPERLRAGAGAAAGGAPRAGRVARAARGRARPRAPASSRRSARSPDAERRRAARRGGAPGALGRRAATRCCGCSRSTRARASPSAGRS